MKASFGLVCCAAALAGCLETNPAIKHTFPAKATPAFPIAYDGQRLEGTAEGAVPAAQPARANPAAAPAPTVRARGTLVRGAPQPQTFALVIGIEKYRDLPTASGAKTDAERYRGLATTTLGLTDDHVRVMVDDHATRSDIEEGLDWLSRSVGVSGRALFFYSGHGAPDASTGSPYLVPYDGNPASLDRSAIPLASVLARLGATKGREAVAVIDAGFSGAGGRSVLPSGSRPLVAVKATKPSSKVALLTAGSDAQIAGAAANGGGLLSQSVVAGLGEALADGDGDGQVSLKELFDWVRPRVQREARSADREQVPALLMGTGLGRPDGIIMAWGVGE